MNKLFSSIKILIAVVVTAMVISSCGKNHEQANYIPKDANVVLTIDVKSLGIKTMDFKELFSIENIKKTISGKKSKDSTIEKFKNSGIDLLNTAYLFGNIKGEDNGYGGLIIALTDKDKFEKFIQDHEKKFNVSTEGDYKLAMSEEENNGVIAWNKNTAVFLFQNSKESVTAKDRVLSILNMKKEESLAQTDKNFGELLKQSGDISFWISFEELGKLAKNYHPAASNINFDETYFTAVCNFEKGEVDINTKYHANKEISEKLNFTKDNISKELAAAVPGKSVIGMLSLALDMSKFYTYLDKEKLLAGVEQDANGLTGMTSKEIFEIFNGELVATLNGVSMKEVRGFNYATGEEEMQKQPSPDFAVLIGINDKEKSSKLLNSLAEKGVIQKQENVYNVMGQYYIVDKGSYLVLASEGIKQVAIDGSGEKLNAEMTSLLTQNSAAAYFGVNNIPDEALAYFGSSVKDWAKQTPLESVTISATSMKDQISSGKCLIDFKQKDQNSLVTLAKMSDDLATQTVSATPQPMPIDTASVSIETIEIDEETEEE